jgi:hypothetical protein
MSKKYIPVKGRTHPTLRSARSALVRMCKENGLKTTLFHVRRDPTTKRYFIVQTFFNGYATRQGELV